MARTMMTRNSGRSGESLPLLDMPHSLPEQGNDVIVFNAVVDFLAIPPSDDQAHLAQATQMVRGGRLADPDHLGQRADVQFLDSQSVQDANPARIAEGTEEFRHMGGGMFIKKEICISLGHI